MVTGCAHCGRFLSFQRKEALNPDLIAGHWYGCPGCGRNVCDRCGQDSAQRCLGCGERLAPDQKFPTRLHADDSDWREFVAYAVEQQDFFGNQEVLVACVTESSFADIDAALGDYLRDVFRRYVRSWDVMRRLGAANGFFLDGSERRWTPEWERRLAVAGEGYRTRADAAARDALDQDEVLHGWTLMAPALPLPIEDVLTLALHPDDRVAQHACSVLSEAEPAAEVREGCVRLFRSAEGPRLRRALALISTLSRERGPIEIDDEPRHEIEQRVCAVLAARAPAEREALIRRYLTHAGASPRDATASLVDMLELGPEVVPWLIPSLASKRSRVETLRFLADMGTSAASARDAVRELIERTNDYSIARPGLIALRKMGMSWPAVWELTRHRLQRGSTQAKERILGGLLALWEDNDEEGLALLREPCREWAESVRTPEERLRLIELLHRLKRSRRDMLFPGLPAPAELFLSLLEDTRDNPPSLFDASLLELHHESPRLRAWLMDYTRTHDRYMLSSGFIEVAGPGCEALVPLLCEVVQSSKLVLHRLSATQALGRIARGRDSPAHDVLLGRFLDPREWRVLRLAAAQALWSAGRREFPVARLAPVLEDSSAALRCWALLLADHVEEARLAALRHDALPLVRRVAQARGAQG